ncbi:hypothetical protein GS507_19125 [Rhodococcus hoagii]|nr:hypothetical protein [Prescottella equi]MBM4696255.1 hypothetical protein [Prescottella equi]
MDFKSREKGPATPVTPKADFRAVEARIARAKKFRGEMGALRKDDDASSFTVTRVRRGSSIDLVASCELRPELGIVFGDWLANVRASLDYLFFQLAIEDTKKYPPTRQGSRQFPIKRTLTEFEALRGSDVLHGLSEETIKAIESMQPYHTKYGAEGNALLWLHDLARMDRHREPFKMGTLIKNWKGTAHQVDGVKPLGFDTQDPTKSPLVVGAGETLLLGTLRCASEADAMNQEPGIELSVDCDLEAIDWYRDTHRKGISANIRNDTLEERMKFVEDYMGLVVAHFKKTHG